MARPISEVEWAIVEHLVEQGLRAPAIAARMNPPMQGKTLLDRIGREGIPYRHPRGRMGPAEVEEQRRIERKIFGDTAGFSIFEHDLAVQQIELLADRLGYDVVVTKRDKPGRARI